jgi:hypothetical protein
MTNGLAGLFVRVLNEGHLEENMTLTRIENPHPKWTLEYISKTLYGEGDRKHMLMGWAQWARSKKELEELCALVELGWYEWKGEAQWLLDRWGRADVMIKPTEKIVHKNQVDEQAISWLSTSQTKIDEWMKLSFMYVNRDDRVTTSSSSLLLLLSQYQEQLTNMMTIVVVGLAWFGFRSVGGYP